MKTTFSLLVLLAGIVPPATGQVFTNLDFEQAVVVVNDPFFGFLDWNLAVPGWGHLNSSDTSIVYYRHPHTGLSPYYLLVDSQSHPSSLLAGNYSLEMANGLLGSPPNTTYAQAFLSQTGAIPSDARSIHLLGTGPMQVMLGGDSIPLLPLGGFEYAGDISAYAGTTTELRIVNAAMSGASPLVVDNIAFSAIPIPEPSTLVLVGACIASSAIHRLRITHRRRRASLSTHSALK
jgi:hypothetical protein